MPYAKKGSAAPAKEKQDEKKQSTKANKKTEEKDNKYGPPVGNGSKKK
ncbi:MAG: hypothetical protein JWQ09_1889 [Segetibacter sp.]|nr:hypothetical protein [Segetibacter sp.]